MKDFDIRLAMKGTTLSKFYHDDSIVVEELSLPSTGSRIDIAVVNGHLHGYEIKSACDTLKRLNNQIEGYSKVFDYLSIITEDKYINKILNLAPNWIGVSCSSMEDDKISISTIRKGERNNSKEGFYVAKLLRKEEIQLIMNDHNITYKKSSRVWTLCEILAQELNIEDLSYAVRIKLKQRADWKLHSKAGLRSL